MDSTKEDIKAAEEKTTLGGLRHVLYILSDYLEKFKDEVDRSDALLKIGEKTKLSKQIEKHLNDPMHTIFEMSANVDQNVKGIVDRLVTKFLQTKVDIIMSAYQTKNITNDLHYAVVLKEDTTENRDKIFSFLDSYGLFDISSRYPVYFQFVPSELISNIAVKGEISLQ